MVKLRLLLVLFCVSSVVITSSLYSQGNHQFHQQVSSDNWEIIGELEYRVIDEYEYYPIFSDNIKQLKGKEIELIGYMVPIREGLKHDHFLISVLPVDQCYFCGSDGIPIMVEVFVIKGITYVDSVIKVKGKVELKNDNIALEFPIVLKNAVIDLRR
jgi:hypothetical protein